MLTVTEISEDSVTVFSTFFLIKNYQRILDSNPLTQFSVFRAPTIDKDPLSTTGGASKPLPPTSQLSVKHSDNKKALPKQCLNGSPLLRLNQHHREPCHASSCGSRLFLLVFSQKADRCAKPCSLFPPPAALLRLCHRLRPSVLSISGNKKALRLQCLNGSPCPA